MTKVAIVRERREFETRVAATPDTVKKLVSLGLEVSVEAGAGMASSYPDDDYKSAGATLVADAAETLQGAEILLKVAAPLEDELPLIPKGTVLIGLLSPYQDGAAAPGYAAAGIDAFAMEFIPRITRAQSMDVLSSQSNLAGYKAVIDAAAAFGRAMPMMMTAAGSIAPARVMVLGAGVAGLQAIATARRLGAVVSATDVRLAAKEQVESLGATFVMVESEESRQAETAGGYAKEMSEDYKAAQAALVAKTLKKQDMVICTALIPGRAAPLLVTEDMVRSMKVGSVIVDLAVEQGGNCALSKPGEMVQVDGITILGYRNVPGRVATDASAMYAKNLLNFVSLLIDSETKAVKVNWEDEIIKATCLTRDGQVVHPSLV